MISFIAVKLTKKLLSKISFKKLSKLLDKDIKYDITFINYLSNTRGGFKDINLKDFFAKKYIYHTILALTMQIF